jgi:hypothetical protein
VVEVGLGLVGIAQRARQVRLRVGIDHEHALPRSRQRGGEVDGGGGFAGAAFLDGDGKGGHIKWFGY